MTQPVEDSYPELSEENKAYMDHLTRDQLVVWAGWLGRVIEEARKEGHPEYYPVQVRAKLMRDYIQKRLNALDILAAIPFGTGGGL